jgi:TolB-like protein/DNA-binding winged helix-turn-helix (wHTH) protein/Flp pilus assembly protein TadD
MIDDVHRRYLLGDYWLEPDKQRLSHEGRSIKLARRPFEVLLYLIEHRSRFVSRAELLDRFWNGKDVYDDALRKCIGTIRNALEDHSDQPKFVETRWGVGYRYIGPIEEQLVRDDIAVVEIEKTRGMRIRIEEEEIQDENELERAATGFTDARVRRLPSLRSFPRVVAVALPVVSVAIAALALFGYRHGRIAPPAIQPAPIRSVAVLPLRNLSNDPDSEYFADGVTENLINTLSRIEGLKVISRSSVFTFRGKEVDPREAGKKLGVGALLEGSVLRKGDHVRVDVRLVSTDDGHVLWASNTYDRPVGDVFTLQDEIARNTAAGLRLQLSGADEKRLTKRYTDNAEAYHDLLRGWYFWSQRTPSGIKKAIESYQQATEKDPHCAMAYAGLAGSYAMSIWCIPAEPKEAMRKAKAAAARAVEIDPNLSEAHLAMSTVLGYQWDWAGAQQEIERARELDPSFSTYGYAYHLLLAADKPDEAVRWIKRSEELDPLSPLVSANVAQILYFARRYDEAIEQCRKTLELDPNYFMTHTYLGQAYIQKGRHSEAIEALQKAVTLSERNPDIVAILGYAYAAAGNREEAEKIRSELIALSRHRHVPAYPIAEIYAELDQKDEAFAWLERAYQEHAGHLVSIKVEPTFDSLRPDPRYADLLRRLRLPG